MLKSKRFKDPIYGYIDIDENIIKNIIDTAGFQRLRNIIQTSYAPLFSSAVHNRFVHSLGVYHLGCIVTKSLSKRNQDYTGIENYQRFFEIFEIACLLHDLGHAPFSHTGEEFYLENSDRTNIHNDIVQMTNDPDLSEEIKSKNYKAAPHELMSVYVALKDYEFLFETDEEKGFFARCITGYLYTTKDDTKHSFLNCLITLLNSSVIDVDKLDYLIRDAYITGFETVKIDYVRLLQSIKFRKGNGIFSLVYTKGAVSVIENFVYAHDAERKWIQNHPVVQYEAYLLQRVIEDLKKKYTDVDMFSYKALTEEGIQLSDEFRISLLCDADIIFLMKNLDSELKKEYFQRNLRRHPLWKSEAEYKASFRIGYANEIFEIMENGLEELCKYLNFVCKSSEINDNALAACKEDLEKAKELLAAMPDKEKMSSAIAKKEQHLKWLEALKRFSEEEEIPYDFVILNAKQFNSGFAKEAFGKIQIEFDEEQKTCDFKTVTNTLKADKSIREKFFYLFYRRDEKKKIHFRKLAMSLGALAQTIYNA